MSSSGQIPQKPILNPRKVCNCDPATGAIHCHWEMSAEPIRYADGQVVLAVDDLASGGFGMPWGHRRSYNNQLSENYDFDNGYNWMVSQWPYLVEENAGDTIAVVFDGNRAYWFDRVGGFYVARYGAKETFFHDAANEVFRLVSTDGTTWEFHDFWQYTLPQGAFRRAIAPGGQVTEVIAYNDLEQIADVRRSHTAEGRTTTESYLYSYVAGGENATRLEHVTLRRRVDDGEWQNLQRVCYTYYASGDDHGSLGDLKTAAQQGPSGESWSDGDTHYYRYYLDSAGGVGFAHGLKYALDPAAYAALCADAEVADPLAASDSKVAQYARYSFEYDADRRVTKERVYGASRQYEFSYTAGTHADGPNQWKQKTVETLPDGSQQVIYTNYLGQVLVKELRAGSDRWIHYRQYNEDGNLVIEANPSAVLGYVDDAGAGSDELQVTLASDEGLIRVYDYYATTDLGSGAVAGYKQFEKIRRGSAGTEIKLAEYRYTQRTVGGVAIHPLATRIVFRNEDGTGAIETGFGYTWHPDTFQAAQRTTTLPAVPVEQNGPGASATRVEVFDLRGNLTWLCDERGFLTRHAYDAATGARTQTIADVDTTRVADAPEGWTTPSGGGLHLVSDFEHDAQGRITQVLGPLHNASGQPVRTAAWTVYDDLNHETRTARGYAVPETDGEGYDFALVNPVAITKTDASGNVLEEIQAVRGTTLGRLSAEDRFARSSFVRWTTHAYENGQLLRTRVYHAIPAEGAGASGANYDQTTYGCDSLGRQNMIKSPGGTITRTVFDARGLALRTFVGADDSDATQSDPTGAGQQDNNMVLVTEREYDEGTIGDGNLTQETQHVDDDPQQARVTRHGYDWRNRRVTTDGEIDFFEKAYYDNLDRAVRVDRHDTTEDGNLVARVETLYDDLGRVYRAVRHAVDPATGSVTGKLTDNAWYDLAGNKIKQKPAGSEKFAKTVYDGLGRPIKAYVGFDLDESSWAEAGNVGGDTIFEQTENAYDAGGNVIQETRRSRMHTALDSQTGELTSPDGAEPKACVSYAAHWHDGIGRRIASAHYGTYGGAALTRPDGVPDRAGDGLLTTIEYNDRGEPYLSIDPMGREDLQVFDDAGRLTETVENVKVNPQGSDESRTTRRSYTADGRIATLTAVNPATGDQVTRYVYGTTLADSQVARSDLLRAEIYPDSDDPSDWPGDGDDRVYDRVEYAYNRQGQVVSKKDQNETLHAFDYDRLGRPTQDRVVQLGPGVHGLVRRIARTYEVRGLAETITSLTNASVGSGDLVNQVRIEYNAAALPIGEYQSHQGAVDMANTPRVAYGYDETLSGDEFAHGLRRSSLTYPNGRILRYEYSPGADSHLNRTSFLADDDSGGIGTHLAEYTRLGLDQFVRVVSPQPRLRCDLAHGSGPDPYDGLDRFGRVIDLVWRNDATGEDVERIKHGYDRAGNRLYRECPVKGPLGIGRDELYTYDDLDQLKTFTRGCLNAQKTAIASPSFAQSWDLDSTGNWRGFREDRAGDGHWDLDQTREHNAVNEITGIHATTGVAWVTPHHDRNGNLVRLPQPSDPTQSFTATYDAWNRLVRLTDGANTIAEYAYDGRNFRTLKKTYADGLLCETRHFYYSDQWQVLEERLGDFPHADRQFVWGPRYVDDLVLRDRDTSTPADGTLDERLYALQSRDGSVVAVADVAGSVASRYMYSGSGSQTVLTSAGVQVLSSRFDWDYGYRAYRIEPALGLGFRNQVFSFCLGRFLTGRYSQVAGSHRDLGVDEAQGSTDCDPQGGPAKTWVNPTLNTCASACVKRHEDTHAEDMNSDTHPIGKCCKAMQKAYNREGLSDEDRQKILANWKDWIHAPINEAIAECKAYKVTADCAADILTEHGCACWFIMGKVPNINDYRSREQWNKERKEYYCCEGAWKQSVNAVQKASNYCEEAKGKNFDACPDFEHL